MNQGCVGAQVTVQEEIMKIIPQVHQAVVCSQKGKVSSLQQPQTYQYKFYNRQSLIKIPIEQLDYHKHKYYENI